MSSEEPSKSAGWYPGKYASKAIRRASTAGAASNSGHDGGAASAAMSGGGYGNSDSATSTSTSTGSVRVKSDALRRRSVMAGGASPIMTMSASAEKGGVTPSTPRSSQLPRSFGDARSPIGNCHLQIYGLKYPSLTNPSVRVELDGDVRNYEDLTEFFEENLTIFDISSQVVITLMENYSIGGAEIVGQIILPLSAYLGMNKPLPAIREHRMFFPVRPLLPSSRSSANVDQVGVFRSGFEGANGSAMTKPRQALGFIDMKMELTLIDAKMASFYVRPPMAVEYNYEAAFLEGDDVSFVASMRLCTLCAVLMLTDILAWFGVISI
jgi:hypothetical protein